MRNPKPVMLVEDDRLDVMAVQRAMKDLNITNPLVHTINGEEALKHLEDKNNKRPCLILLDLNMPKMNGIEFLKAVKDKEDLRKIPVIVLTTSKQDRDVVDSFKLGVAGYMVKSVDYKEFVEVIRTINLYWTLSESPDGDE